MADYTHGWPPRGSCRWDTISTKGDPPRSSLFHPYDSISAANILSRSALETFMDYCKMTKMFCLFAASTTSTMLLAKFSEVGADPFWMCFCVIGTLLLPFGAVNSVNNSNTSALLLFGVLFFYIQQCFLGLLFVLFLFGGPFFAWSNVPLAFGSVLSLMSMYQGWLTIKETRRIRAGGELRMPPRKFNKVLNSSDGNSVRTLPGLYFGIHHAQLWFKIDDLRCCFICHGSIGQLHGRHHGISRSACRTAAVNCMIISWVCTDEIGITSRAAAVDK